MLEKLEKPEIRVVDTTPDGKHGKFCLSPLECGFGNTVGNSMRRVLLSSMPGVAVTSVKIEGVQHEFSTIPGVKEDVTEIILNIKGIAAKLHCDIPKTARIRVEGEREVTAGDIEADSELEILSPDTHIATLGDGVKLEMELTFERGRGYVSAEKNKQFLPSEIGVIAVDSIYTPVLKVNYAVENVRVGQRTDYDSLMLDVKTDGTIGATEAVSYAAKILTEHLALFVGLSSEPLESELVTDSDDTSKDKILDMNIDDLELSVRSFNCLKRAGINTVGDLINKSPDEMMKVRNLGKKSFEEVRDKIRSLGYDLAVNDEI
ncbi:DNA-directed RNA polymerase subunit alpha [Clostridia bacterium]|nr:DNA-directed RNA polymerase subunit alpha [Clostridia bacterium]